MRAPTLNRLLVATLPLVALFGCSSSPPSDPAPSAGAQPAAFTEQPTPPSVDCTPLPVKGFRSIVTVQGTNQFDVSCNKIEAVAVKQREQTWCWAACAEMLDRYRGIVVDQAVIVQRIKDEAPSADKDQTANQMQIWLAMNPEMQAEYDQRRKAWQKPGQIDLGIHVNANLKNLFQMSTKVSPDVIVEELSAGNPILLGMRGDQWGEGHIVVAYGAVYSRLDPDELPKYRYVGIAPLPGSNSNTLQWNDLINGAVSLARGDSRPHYSIASIDIIDPQPDKDPFTNQDKSQFSTLNDSDLEGHLDFFIGRTEAAAKLKAYMLTALATPQEMPQQPPPQKEKKIDLLHLF
jgi:hypothetical protein